MIDHRARVRGRHFAGVVKTRGAALSVIYDFEGMLGAFADRFSTVDQAHGVARDDEEHVRGALRRRHEPLSTSAGTIGHYCPLMVNRSQSSSTAMLEVARRLVMRMWRSPAGNRSR